MIYCNKLFFVLGGGIDNGSLPNHVSTRCDEVIDQATSKDHVLTSSSFSLNVPPNLDKDGYILSEASLMAKYLQANNLACPISTEQQSHDTFGAFFFLFALYFDIIKFNKLVIITSDFHVERSSLIFNHLNKYWGYNPPVIKDFEFIKTNTSKSDEIKSRINHEKSSISILKKRFSKLQNKDLISEYVLTKHSNYSLQYSGRKLDSGQQGY